MQKNQQKLLPPAPPHMFNEVMGMGEGLAAKSQLKISQNLGTSMAALPLNRLGFPRKAEKDCKR